MKQCGVCWSTTSPLIFVLDTISRLENIWHALEIALSDEIHKQVNLFQAWTPVRFL